MATKPEAAGSVAAIAPGVPLRPDDERSGRHLEYFTLAWNLIEAVVAVVAASAAGSVALLGFGIDSVIESLSGAVLLWRLQANAGRAREWSCPGSVDRLRLSGKQIEIALVAVTGGLWETRPRVFQRVWEGAVFGSLPYPVRPPVGVMGCGEEGVDFHRLELRRRHGGAVQR